MERALLPEATVSIEDNKILVTQNLDPKYILDAHVRFMVLLALLSTIWLSA